MKRQLLTGSMIITVIAIACHKNPVSQPAPPIVTPVLKVKDINEKNLPSPFYHFEYDDSGKITLAGYSSSLRIYDVNYNGSHIESMENIADLSHTEAGIRI